MSTLLSKSTQKPDEPVLSRLGGDDVVVNPTITSTTTRQALQVIVCVSMIKPQSFPPEPWLGIYNWGRRTRTADR